MVEIESSPKSPPEKRKAFLEERVPQIFKEAGTRSEARRRMGELLKEASENYVLSRRKSTPLSEREESLQKLYQELDSAGITDKDPSHYLIEREWTRKGTTEHFHQILLRNDIALRLEGRSIRFDPEEIQKMQDFIVHVRLLQERITREAREPEGQVLQSEREIQGEKVAAFSEPENLLRKWQAEVVRGTMRGVEEQSGLSFEFSEGELGGIRGYLEKRIASLIGDKVERYLQDHQDQAKAKGINPYAKGTAAIRAIYELGGVEEIIKSNPELERAYYIFVTFQEFSPRDIPLAPRFVLLEQLNDIQELNPGDEELKKLRIQVFEKWSGYKPDVEIPAEGEVERFFEISIKQQKLQELCLALTAKEKTLALDLGITEENLAILKEAGYTFERVSFGLIRKFVKGKKGESKVFFNQNEVDFNVVRSSLPDIRGIWEQKLRKHNQARLLGVQEKAAHELISQALLALTKSEPGKTDAAKAYNALRTDIEAMYQTRILANTKRGKEVLEETERALETVEGKSVRDFIKEVVNPEGVFTSLKGEDGEEKEKLIKIFTDIYGLDAKPEDIEAFERESGLQYNTVAKKKINRLSYLLKFVVYLINKVQQVGGNG